MTTVPRVSPDAYAARRHTSPMTPARQYEAYIAGADTNDRRRFDSYLLGYLLHAVDDETRTAALEAAAADVNGGAA